MTVEYKVTLVCSLDIDNEVLVGLALWRVTKHNLSPPLPAFSAMRLPQCLGGLGDKADSEIKAPSASL